LASNGSGGGLSAITLVGRVDMDCKSASKWGMSWQITPQALTKATVGADPAVANPKLS
jgi:predicted 3-demethylubiquinone-9 3-methyltransferase (glyoxalase superfamily)